MSTASRPVVTDFTAAHIGDLHFWRLPRWDDHLLGKRLLGTANLLLRRAHEFRQGMAPQLCERLVQLNPDWALFSGDFTTTSLDTEFQAARKAFAPLHAAMPRRVLGVPGNHDRYTWRDARRRAFERLLEKWWPEDRSPFFLPLVDGVWLIGIDASTNNGLGSYGRILEDTAERLQLFWARHKNDVRELWILCHFPAEDPPGMLRASRSNQLRDAWLLFEFLDKVRVPILYLHGHHHHRWAYGSQKHPGMTYLNAGAPWLKRLGREPDLGFYELHHRAGATAVFLHTREAASGHWHQREVRLPPPGELVDLQS